ncbi:MAG: YdcF family protein [Acetobacteraceae bacterium]
MEGDGAMVGRDGAAMLALALGVGVLSLGLAPLAALAGVAWHGLRAPVAPAAGRRRWVLVLGARLGASGRPGRAFRARLARAAALWAADPGLRIVILGGLRPPAPVSEAAAGRAFLLAAGVADQAIVLEPRSRHTLENLRCYRADLAPEGAEAVLVTSRPHLARSLAMAAGLGLRVVPCAAEPSPLAALHPWFWPREAMLLLWYAVGSRFAAMTANRAMLARIR